MSLTFMRLNTMSNDSFKLFWMNLSLKSNQIYPSESLLWSFGPAPLILVFCFCYRPLRFTKTKALLLEQKCYVLQVLEVYKHKGTSPEHFFVWPLPLKRPCKIWAPHSGHYTPVCRHLKVLNLILNGRSVGPIWRQ